MKIVFLVPEGIPLVAQMAANCFWHPWEDVIRVITQWPRQFFYVFPLFVHFSTCFSTFWQWTWFGLLFGRWRCEPTNKPTIILQANTDLQKNELIQDELFQGVIL